MIKILRKKKENKQEDNYLKKHIFFFVRLIGN